MAKEYKMKRVIFFVFPIALATAFTTASAFTLTGTVNDEAGGPISGALVKLLAKGDSTSTDQDGSLQSSFSCQHFQHLHGLKKVMERLYMLIRPHSRRIGN